MWGDLEQVLDILAKSEPAFDSPQQAVEHHTQQILDHQTKIADHETTLAKQKTPKAWDKQALRVHAAAIPLHKHAINLWSTGADPKDAQYASMVASRMSHLAKMASDASVGKSLEYGEEFDALVKSIEIAVDVLKGEFRGGDPEWLEQKKKDKEDEAAAEGDIVSAALNVLKAEEGEGAFRGGDPELLQQKREEKRQQMEDAGGGEEDTGEPEEEPDLADIEEAQQKEEDRKEAAGKSFPFGITDAGHEVSPVDTLEDYRPRNSNGDPLDSGNLYPDQPDIEPGPPRQGPNQWKPWSEVLGFKVPPEGAPWQHLRRYVLSGDSPEKIQHEAQLMARSVLGLEQYPEYDQRVHKAFFDIYDNLNRGITWRPDFQILKAEKGEVVSGHKYVYRWMGDRGQWEYEYADTSHAENHGIQHTGSRQGHTVDIHPEWEAQGLDPTHANPEAAFHHARSKAMETGGTYPLSVMNPVTSQAEKKILRIKPGVTSPLELHDESEEKPGKPAKGSKPSRFAGFEGLEEHIRTHHLNTEYDIHGNPWIEWMSPKLGTKRKVFEEMEGEKPEVREKRLAAHKKQEESARIRWRFSPDSPYARKDVSAVDPKTGLWRGPGSEESLRRYVTKEKRHQLVAAGLADPEKSTVKLDPVSDKPYTEAVHSGLPRHRIDIPFMRTVSAGAQETAKKQLQGSRRAWEVDWKNSGHRQEEFLHGLQKEHQGLAVHLADRLVKEFNQKNPEHALSDAARGKVISELKTAPLVAAVKRAVDTYEPSRKVSFPTYLYTLLRGEMKSEMRRAMQLRAAGTETATTLDDEAVQRKQDEAVASSPPEVYEESFPEWLNRARQHVDQVHMGWLETNQHDPSADFEGMNAQRETADTKLSDMEEAYRRGGDEEEYDPNHFTHYAIRVAKIDPAFVPPAADSAKADAISDYMRQKLADVSPQALESQYGSGVHTSLKHVGFKHPVIQSRIKKEYLKTLAELIASHRKTPIDIGVSPREGKAAEAELRSRIEEVAPGAMSKANPQPPQEQPPDVSYVGQQGEPGALRFLYEAGPGGNIVQGTNAPEWHSDHLDVLGSPQVHANEPNQATNPELFDEQGRKLDRPIPQDAEIEDNPNYDPDKANGNYWVKRFADPQSGNMQYAYLHRDHILDPKMKNNLTLKYVDAQLPKIRQWYQSMIESENLPDKALGLFIALLDQGRVPATKLENLKVSDVYFGKNNVVTLKFADGSIQIVLDPSVRETLESLLIDKDAADLVFIVAGQILDRVALNKFMYSTFGVLPSALLTYHATKDFSTEFQKLASKIKGDSPLDYLQASKDRVLAKVADGFGMTPEELSNYIDPIAVEASIMSAYVHGSIAKSDHELQDKYVFQGLPISIENKKGSVRKWYDSNANNTGQTKMHFDYGFINRTLGTDGDNVDVYIGPNKDAETVYVVHQMKAPDFTKYDEDKTMLGFSSEKEAKEAYLKQYDDPKFFGSCTAMPVSEFKKKVFKTKSNPHMIKAMVWPVSANLLERNPDEEAFSQWIHSYPIHEHEFHWQALSRHHQRKQSDQEQRQQIESQGPQGVQHLADRLEAVR